MASSRLQRRPLLLAALLVASLYLITVLTTKPGVILAIPSVWSPHNLVALRSAASSARQAVLRSPAASPSAATGFERALPSCRIADLIDDPLVREYGQNNIRLSRTYEGTGARVRNVLRKAMRGEKIKIAAVGGSVSSGHGVPYPHTAENYMYKMIQKWFLDTFPQQEHELNLDSCIPATTAWYFSYCLSETIPDDADLVLLELDINSHPPIKESLQATEALYRSILAMKNEPALIYISVFSPLFEDMTHGWRHSALISQWLDVPEINIRNFYIPHLLNKPTEMPYLFKNYLDKLDIRHMNTNGHRATAEYADISIGAYQADSMPASMVIGYLREQLCLLQREGPVDLVGQSPAWPKNEIAGALPRIGMLQHYDEESSIPLLHPKCNSITSTKFPLTPSSMVGWAPVNRNDKRSFEATEVGSEITFNVNVDAGVLGIYFWMTKDESFGQVACWVDNDKRPERIRRVSGYNPHHRASTFEHSRDMWTDLDQGAHTLTCKLEAGKKGGHIFRISATVTR